ncbi:MAG: short-chain fatty acid transporter [Alphaproteobacteria bacterium]|nr:short-chain fatty acid transporter [Alphaproteobacteria bacterium]
MASEQTPAKDRGEGLLARLGLTFTNWAERWFPDAYVFVALAVAVVAVAAILNGASAQAVAVSFGDGFWSLITFTMQMAMVVISGYVVASSPPAAKLIDGLAALPRGGRAAVAFVAAVSMLTSLLNWGMSLIFSGLLVRALARRTDLHMDYRAAGAAGYLGLGATWALGLSSSAAQLQANAASLPKPLLAITGVIPFSQTIFLWQSIAIAVVLIVISMLVSLLSAPSAPKAVTAQMMDVSVEPPHLQAKKPERPGEWLEYSPLITLIVVALGGGWLAHEFATKDPVLAISNLNTYNLMFLMLGALLHWRPRNFLDAVAKAVPATTGVLIQFPLYGGIASMMTTAKGAGGLTVADQVAHAFVSLTTHDTFPVAMGIYSAVLGFFIPSGGGKWVIEAPYVMQAANDLKVHLGWAVQVYNTAEALPNLINPFWMLPLLGVLGLKARDIVGFTFLQLVVHLPVVLFLLWLLAKTLTYMPPVIPQ